MNLFELVVRRPVATWMLALATAVFGLISYERLPLNLMPDLAYPTLTVRTEADGYAPEEVESQLSRPIEEALATVAGLQELESRSRAGLSDVVLEFDWGTSMDEASQSVRERLQTTFLPDDVRRPLLLRYDPGQEPFLRIALGVDPSNAEAPRGDDALYLLRQVAVDDLKPALEAMDGVAAVRVRGGLEREVRIEVHEDWLAARKVRIDQVVGLLAAENINVPGGSILDGDQEYLLRTVSEMRTLEELAELSVRRSDGVRVPLPELADISETHRDREVISRLDGGEAVELEIFRAADANIVRVAERIDSALHGTPDQGPAPGVEGLVDTLPPGVAMTVLENQAEFIEASIANLRSTAALGALLAVTMLFLFLRDFRTTAIVATAIPLSIVATFAPMYTQGVSLNLMSLGGLALGIGMLVDNAVVVLENIHAHRERGSPRVEAAVEGTREVAAAVIASTLTTVSVFGPIAFVEGMAGQVFGDLSMAVVFSLLASLVVALFFVPMLAAVEWEMPTERTSIRQISHAARFRFWAQFRDSWRPASRLRRALLLPWWTVRAVVRLFFELLSALVVFPSAALARLLMVPLGWLFRRGAATAMWLAGGFQHAYQAVARRYARDMLSILGNPGTVLVGAGVALVLTLYLAGDLGRSLIPELHQGRFTAEVALPIGTPLSRTADVASEIEGELAVLPGVRHVHVTVGSEKRADSRTDEGEHTARLSLELPPGADLEEREERVMALVRQRVDTVTRRVLPGAEIDLRLVRPSLFSLGTPIEVLVLHDDLRRLRTLADAVRDRLATLGGLDDVRSSLSAGYPEVRIRYDRTLLSRYGLDTSTVAAQVRDKIQGNRATTLSRREGRIDLVVRLTTEERHGLDELKRLNINPSLVPPIPLEMVAQFDLAEGPSEIRRIDQRRTAAIGADLLGIDLQEQAADIGEALDAMGLPGLEWELSGQHREMSQSLKSLQMALLLAIFLVYVIMASTFESVLHPFVILLSVPLGAVGVVLALAVTATPVSVVVLIGAIVLAGVVVNNAIVLVDAINRLRARGMARSAAIHQAATLRLRPILITTATTVLGLLPLALGYGEGAEIQRPLALTIIAGLITATGLTLVVIPVVYLTLTRLFERSPHE